MSPEHDIAVLDIDLTLLENAPRTRSLLVDFVRERDLPELEERALTMPLVFSIKANLEMLGIPTDLVPDGLRFWRHAFFDPARLTHDVPLPGALEAVHALRARGTTIVYLTARPSRLAAGTITSFAAHGFPIACPGAILVTKEDEAEKDHVYKARALRWIGKLGTVTLCADNEPAHCNEMHAAFPDARTVLVETRHSEPAPALAPAIVRVPSLTALL